jgi:uncharacterized protein YlxP (DUF503 family)
MEITISQETYAVIHRLMSIGMDQVLDDPQTDTDTMCRILDHVTLFSTWNRVPLDQLEQQAGF